MRWSAPQERFTTVPSPSRVQPTARARTARSSAAGLARRFGKLAEARLLYGNVLLRQKQYAQAAEQYRQLAALAPGDGSAQARLAIAQAAAGHCADALRGVNGSLRSRPRDGGLLQTFVRLAATCQSASSEERRMAVDYAQALYKQRPDVAHSEALAMALASTGKAKDAVDYEAQAMFEAVRANDQAALA